MIQQHEIPSQSRLYFQDSAKLKREIENISASIFEDIGYTEIVTPFFTYHQSFKDKKLIRLSDATNNTLYLRADSSIDVVRIITKRLGRSIDQKKWFYIQPVFHYPSTEIYQIGSEELESSDLSQSINVSSKILKSLKLEPLLQISNIQIPKKLSQILDIPIEVFKSSNIQKLLDLNLEWLTKLTYLQELHEIKEILDIVPQEIKVELEKIADLADNISYENIVISPLYYSKMDYYEGLFFRYIAGNSVLGMGGCYEYEDMQSSGFALYTDKLIEERLEHE
jgi:ATP phosphoribosyltransferase regulatory subunit HisZ